jgi:UDP-N-acetylmuramyl pentapeptide phosphotransferase/UDP-N-acetylglucosamine-1-phosphate transferase
MSPLHHPLPEAGYHESKIVSRFWIVNYATVLTLVTYETALKFQSPERRTQSLEPATG